MGEKELKGKNIFQILTILYLIIQHIGIYNPKLIV
ncbi:MAG: hypothetical protein EZS26_002041 [Candidatus Ordinivivax streblomastigis]|uniref:Uncharacterized protein n=1 Tax=Candidatus Ordinivivax streblomastigis TaxID=2540710 RepID=A0A5M8P019_9BACT|nr:MAG: hypothetical protein EZS26_002041 [Candidatus Ordinivivax streblomastigis]